MGHTIPNTNGGGAILISVDSPLVNLHIADIKKPTKPGNTPRTIFIYI
jgi:hypothetical protein